MSHLWVRFNADINQKSYNQLARLIDNAINNEFEKISILATSGGGVTKIGVSTYNLLKTCPIETRIFNLGHIESAGVAAFAGADHRFALPTARFLIHRASWHLQERLTRDELAEKVAILDREHEDYFQIFRRIFSCDDDNLHEMLRRGKSVRLRRSKGYWAS